MPTTAGIPLRYGAFIGPDKSGSTWVYRFARSHRAMATAASKELFFFDRYYYRGIDWYVRQFKVNASSEVMFDVCHEYMFSPEAPRRMSRHFPDARIFVVARHPVRRAISAYHYMIRQGRTRVDFSEAIRQIPELIDHARYGRHVERWLEQFDDHQVRVIDFDLLGSDPDVFAEELTSHLGVARAALPSELTGRVLGASSPRSFYVAKLLRAVGLAVRHLGGHEFVSRVKEDRLIQRMLFRPLDREASLKVSPADTQFIEGALRKDTRRLDELAGTGFEAKWWGVSP